MNRSGENSEQERADAVDASQAVVREGARQTTESRTPPSDEETRGMTLRELVLEVRADVKVLYQEVSSHNHPEHVTRKELYVAIGSALTLFLTILALVMV